MNEIYIKMFKCLCLDLGWSVQSIPTIEKRGELKNKLVSVTEVSVEEPDRPGLQEEAFVEFRKEFESFVTPPEKYSGVRFVDDDVCVGYFNEAYQILSFELRKRVDSTTEKEQDYVGKFQQTEKQTRAWRVDPSNWVTRLSRVLLRRGLADLDLSADCVARHGRHGPGSVLCGSRGLDKNVFRQPPHDLSLSYPYDSLFCNERFWADTMEDEWAAGIRTQECLQRHVECRLELVPKDYRGPRGVFVSSKEAMFLQLGQAEALIKAVRSGWISVSYDPASQQPSREAVLTGLIDREECATLDLKDASDRIPLSLVSYLFPRADYVALARTRPSYVWLPKANPSAKEDPYVKHRLAMFAPMGDGKTFQVLSIICCVISVSAVLIADGWAPSSRISSEEIRRAAKKVRVYGDDIIVASRYFDAVVEALEAHNLKVNVGKSFAKGVFREACGADVLYGRLVTPVRNSRSLALDKPLEAADLPRLCALHRALSIRFGEYSRTAELIEDLVLQKWRKPAYTSRLDGEGLFSSNPPGRYRALGYAQRFNWSLQRLEVKCVRYEAKKFAPIGDPRWDLNYALLPKGGKDAVPRPWNPLEESIRSVSGSPVTSFAYNRVARKLGLVPLRVCDRIAHSWLPLY